MRHNLFPSIPFLRFPDDAGADPAEAGGGGGGGGDPVVVDTGLSNGEPAPKGPTAEEIAAQHGGMMAHKPAEEEGDKGEEGENAGDDPIIEGKEPEKAPDERPEHIPEKFWKDGKADLDAMAKAYSKLESAHAKLKNDKNPFGEVPESSDSYFESGLDMSEKADNILPIDADDPGLRSFSEACHKRGIPPDIADGIAQEVLGSLNEFVEAPIDIDAEMKSLGKNAANIVDGNRTYYDSLYANGELTQGELSAAYAFSQTADGVRLLSKMRAKAGEAPIPLQLGDGDDMSLTDLEAEYAQAIRDKDYAKQEKLDRRREELMS